MGGKRSLIFIFIAALVIEHAAMLVPASKEKVFPVRENAAVRGRRIAERMGCFGCHGAEGVRGIANPGADDEVVPALAGGEIIMWADDEEELRAWVLDGQVADRRSTEARSGPDAGQGTERALVMPAYRGVISGQELDDLIAYLKSISGLQFPDDVHVAEGLEAMHELGCFRCHGAMGIGGISNPRSLKGYIPGFGGADYRELVRNRDELRQWIGNGVSDRLANNPFARGVLSRQTLKMPAYADHLDEEDLDRIVLAVEWLASEEWRKQPVP